VDTCEKNTEIISKLFQSFIKLT